MSTVAIEAGPSIWTRAASRLNNWGSKVVGFAKRVGNWFANKTKWIWNTKPVRWVVSQAQFVAGKAWLGLNVVWHYAKVPILWVGTPVLAFMAMPTTATIILGLGVIALAFIAYSIYRTSRHLRTISTPEELREYVDRLEQRLEHFGEPNTTIPGTMSFDDEPVAGETVQQRLINLDEANKQAAAAADGDKFSETQARMHLLMVRKGEVKGIKATATPSAIHNHGRKMAEQTNPDFDWNWDLMHRATLSESARLRTLEKNLGQLTPVK